MKYTSSAIPLCLFTVVLMFQPGCIAQGFLELKTYQELTDFAVKSNGLISAVMDYTQCTTNFELGNASSIVTADEFRKWIYFKDSGSTDVFRTTKYFLDENGLWSYLKIEATSNNTATAWIKVLSSSTADLVTELIISDCPFGSGVQFYGKNSNMDYDEFSTYEDVKQALLSGRSLRSKPAITECGGVDWQGNGVDILYGSTLVEDWEIVLEEEEEVIHISYNFWVDYFVSAYVGSESIDVWIRPDGSVQMSPAIVDFLTWTNNGPNPDGYQCELGTSFKMVAPAVSGDLATYDTFSDVIGAAKNGREMELMMDAELCDWVLPPGEERPKAVIGHKSLIFDIHDDPSRAKQFIQYYGLRFDSDAHILHSQFGIMNDDTLQAVFHNIDRISGSLRRWIALCPLGTAAVLRSGHHQMLPLASYNELETAVLAGKRVMFQATLDECKGTLNRTGVIIGGSLTDVNVRKTLEGFSDVNAILTDLAYDATTGIFFWGSITLKVNSDVGDVSVTIRGLNSETWQDIFGGIGVWTCPFNGGALFLV